MSSNNIIARRYAQALFEIGLGGGSALFDELAKALHAIAGVFENNDELKRVVKSPLVNNRRALGIADDLGKAMKLPKTAHHFLNVVAEHGRLSLIADINHEFQQKLKTHNGIIDAEIISAYPLSAGEAKKAGEIVKQIAGQGKVNCEFKNDPEILGGVIVRIGSVLIDNSVAHQLKQYQSAMKGQ